MLAQTAIKIVCGADGFMRALLESTVGCVWYPIAPTARRAAVLEPVHSEPTAKTP